MSLLVELRIKDRDYLRALLVPRYHSTEWWDWTDEGGGSGFACVRPRCRCGDFVGIEEQEMEPW